MLARPRFLDPQTIEAGARRLRGRRFIIATGARPAIPPIAGLREAPFHTYESIFDNERLPARMTVVGAGPIGMAFQAVRNALLPFGGSGLPEIVPWTTFTDPEVAHVGLTEAEARQRFGDDVGVTRRAASRIDRAVCEDDTEGFVKLVHRGNGALLGATIVAQRAGEALTEVILALDQRLAPRRIATAIHVYPTYSDGVQQAFGDVAWESAMRGLGGVLIRASLKVFGSRRAGEFR